MVVKVINPKQFQILLKSQSLTSRVIAVDATWYMPNNPLNARAQFREERIPGAAFFDLDQICDETSTFPHMLASYSSLVANLTKLGLDKNDHLVFYDKSGIFSSPRAAWNLALGLHKNVYLLDHYKDYVQQGFKLSHEYVENYRTSVDQPSASSAYEGVSQTEYNTNYSQNVIEYEELLDLVVSGQINQYIYFDARSKDRFTGAGAEPRPGLPSGHIESSLNLPFSEVLTANGNFKSKQELVDLFKKKFDLDLSKPVPHKKQIIVLCGTGVTAVILRVAIESIIESPIPVRVYDGSWTEWGQRAPLDLIVKDI